MVTAFYGLILGMLAVWRITHLLHAEDGPWDSMARLRRLAGKSIFGKLLDCFYCLSVWTAVPFAWCLGGNWKHRLLLWPALSGAAILLERATGNLREPPTAPYFEDPKEKKDGMLQ
jgi:hypothetical protein